MDNRFQTLYRGAPLTAAEMESLFDELFAGTLPPEKLASLLTALIMRGATPPEIAGAARSMRRAALPFPTDRATGDDGGRPGCDRGGRRGRDFGLGRRAADRSGASRCRGRGAGCCRVRQGDEGGDEEVRE